MVNPIHNHSNVIYCNIRFRIMSLKLCALHDFQKCISNNLWLQCKRWKLIAAYDVVIKNSLAVFLDLCWREIPKHLKIDGPGNFMDLELFLFHFSLSLMGTQSISCIPKERVFIIEFRESFFPIIMKLFLSSNNGISNIIILNEDQNLLLWVALSEGAMFFLLLLQ